MTFAKANIPHARLRRMATTDLGRHCNLAWGRVGSPVYSGFLRETASIEEIAFVYQCELWHLHDTHMDQMYVSRAPLF